MSQTLHNANEDTILLADALAMVDAATAPLRARVAELEAYAAHLDEKLVATIATPPAAQGEPVACDGCGSPAIAGILAVINGAMACCPDCSTLTVGERNTIRSAIVARYVVRDSAAPVRVTEAVLDAWIEAAPCRMHDAPNMGCRECMRRALTAALAATKGVGE